MSVRFRSLSLTAACVVVLTSTTNADLPNIVIILADDLGWGDVRCQNPNTKYGTPHIDAVARSGMRFTDAHTPSSVCTPTRYGLLTGRYSWRTRLKQWVLTGFSAPLIQPGRTTLASLLKTKGYRTACVGKWHLGLDWQSLDGAEAVTLENVDYKSSFQNGPTTLGFDTFFGISASNNMTPYCFLRDDRVLEIPIVPKNPVWDAQDRRAKMPPGWDDSQTGIRFTEEAVSFIENHHRNHSQQPFFLYLPSEAPHRPCVPAKQFKGKSGAGVRGDMVLQLDWTVGRIVDTLDQLKLRKNTLIMVSSDNGGRNGDPTKIYGADEPIGLAPGDEGFPIVQEQFTYGHLSNSHWRGQKADIWEAGHRVLCLFSWPGKIASGTVHSQSVCLTDVMATLAAVVNHDLQHDEGEDSFNLLPSLLGKDNVNSVRDHVIHHSGNGSFSIRRKEWKLVLANNSGGFTKGPPASTPGQLYKLDDDPGEQHNRWAEKPEIVEELSTLLKSIQEKGRSR